MHKRALAGFRLRAWIVFAAFAFAAGFLLWTEHRAHLFGALIWIILVGSPFLYLVLYRGQPHGGREMTQDAGRRHDQTGQPGNEP